MQLAEHFRLVQGLPPVADALAGDVYSDVINAKNQSRITFVVHKGAGASGKSTYTVEACDDTTPSNVTAIPFQYKQITGADVEGAMTKCAATGVAAVAGANTIDVIDVDPADIIATGKSYVRLKAHEDTDSPVLAGILVILGPCYFAQDVKPSPIV